MKSLLIGLLLIPLPAVAHLPPNDQICSVEASRKSYLSTGKMTSSIGKKTYETCMTEMGRFIQEYGAEIGKQESDARRWIEFSAVLKQ